MADYTELKDKFRTDDTPTGDEYAELIDLAGGANDKANNAVVDNHDGSITMNGNKITPVSDNKDNSMQLNGTKVVPVSDDGNGNIHFNGKSMAPVKDNQDGTITVNNQTYQPANADLVANASDFVGTSAVSRGQLSSTQVLGELQDGIYGFGQTDTQWPDGPEQLKGKPIWGSLEQWTKGGPTFQRIYTNQQEEWWRQKSGAPAVWGDWDKNAKSSDIQNSNTVSNQFPFRAIISSFSGANLMHLDLYWTNDYATFFPINKSIPNNTGQVRDPSIAYFADRFWIAYTWGVYYSYDLIDFTPVNLPAIKQGVSNWAPEWVVNGNDVYLMATSGSVETWGSTADFRSYWCTFDYTNLEFTPWQGLDYNNPTGVWTNIDNTATYYNGSWWLAMKDEYHYGQADYFPKIRLYKSSQPVGGYQYITDIPFTQKVEGVSLIVADGIMICYADAFEIGATYRLESNNGTTWVNERNVVSSDGSRTQHFTVLPLTSGEQQRTIQKAISYYQPSLAGSGVANFRTSIPRIPLNAGVNDLYPRQGIEYYYHITGDVPTGSLVEVNLHMDYNYGYSKIHFENDNGSGTVTLRINRNDAFYTPNGAPYWETTTYDSPITLVSVGSDDWAGVVSKPYKIVSAPNDRRGGANYLLGTGNGFQFTAPGVNQVGSIMGAYQVSARAVGKALAGQPIIVGFDITVSNGDGGKLFFGFTGGGNWTSTYLNRPFPTGTYHVTQVVMLGRDLHLGDQMRITVDNSAATYAISNVMMTIGTQEHDWQAAPEDPQLFVETISTGSDTNLNNLPANGEYSFGGAISWQGGPQPLSGQSRWGYIKQVFVSTGAVTFQTMYTNQSEVFFRQKSGFPATWGDWLRVGMTQVGTV